MGFGSFIFGIYSLSFGFGVNVSLDILGVSTGFQPSKGNPPFLPAIDWVRKLEAKLCLCWVGGSGHPSTTLKLNGRDSDTVPKMTLSYFWSRGDTPLSPNSSSSFLRTYSLNFGGGVVFWCQHSFWNETSTDLALTGQDADVMQHLLRPLGFFLQSRTLEAMVGCDDLIVFSFWMGFTYTHQVNLKWIPVD